MFNLFVAFDADTWKEVGRYSLERSRFLEYTNEEISSRFSSESALTDNQIKALIRLPCLFMSEDFKGPTRMGKITGIEQEGRTLHISYQLDSTPEIINTTDLAEKIGLYGWEMSRTHWAIKDVDLQKVLAELAVKVSDAEIMQEAASEGSLKLTALPEAPLPTASRVQSVSDFITAVLSLGQAGKEIFYRGHSNRITYKLAPSLFRTVGGKFPYLPVEHKLYRELLVANSKDFRDDKTTLDKLVRMQHFGLPTRLLDITSNPLIALYFACKASNSKAVEGEVVAFKIEVDRIKYFDSDTASCIANLVQLPLSEKEGINFIAKSLEEFNDQRVIKRLLHFIREEKPYFAPEIRKIDLKSVICVKSKRSNDRISSQSGAFLLFGQDAQFTEGGMPEIGIEVERFAISNKDQILNELDQLNINESTVFPYIESSAKYIAQRLAQN